MTEKDLGINQEDARLLPRLSTTSSTAPVTTAGRELDALIGVKIMGWRWMQPPPLREPVLMPAEQWESYTSGAIDLYTVHNCHDYPPERLPAYSTSIADAWLVVEKLRSLDQWITIEPLGGSSAGWHVEVTPFGAGAPETICAATAPLAICFAALKSVGA